MPGTATGWLLSAMPSISFRLEAASVLTSSTFLPASASAIDTAVETDVLPTPPLPVKNRCFVGCSRRRMCDGMGLLDARGRQWTMSLDVELYDTSTIVVYLSYE
jgi:hypothetical protein